MLLSDTFVPFPVRSAILSGTLVSAVSTRSFPRVGHGVGQANLNSSTTPRPNPRHFATTSAPKISMIRMMFHRTFSEILELLLQSGHFPAFLSQTSVALAAEAPSAIWTWTGSNGSFSLAQKYT